MLLYSLDDIWAVAQTVYGEARGEPYEGQLAVAWVIINRAKDERRRWPRTVAGVAKQPYQFSCWNRNDSNSYKLLKVDLFDLTFRRCYAVAALALSESVDDPARGSNHYRAEHSYPKWAEEYQPVVVIGRHLFYRL